MNLVCIYFSLCLVGATASLAQESKTQMVQPSQVDPKNQDTKINEAPPLTNLAKDDGTKMLSTEDLKKYQKSVSGFEYLSVDFIQSRFSALRKKTRKSLGRAQFAKPDRFRWRLESPIADQWIFDGKTLLNYSPDTNSAVRYAPQGGKFAQLRQVVDLVMNFDALLKVYRVTEAQMADNLITIDMNPKRKTDIERVLLTLDTKKNYVSFLKMYYIDGNYTEMTFSNPLRNAISAAEFSLGKNVKITDTN